MKKIIIIFLLILLTVSYAHADVIMLWDAVTQNTDDTSITDLGGYKLYCGAVSGVYTFTKDAGNVLTYTFTSNDLLKAAVHYYCAVVAYKIDGRRGDYSNEVDIDNTACSCPTNKFTRTTSQCSRKRTRIMRNKCLLMKHIRF